MSEPRETTLELKLKTINNVYMPDMGFTFTIAIIGGVTANQTIMTHVVSISGNDYADAEERAHQQTWEVFAAKMRELLTIRFSGGE